MSRSRLYGLVAGLLFVPLGAHAQAPDGQKVFNLQCRSCHAAASSPMGPSLAGVFQGPVAARSDFRYSPALKAKGGVWSEQRLDAYLKAPSAFAPGGRMTYALADADRRKAVIAYLRTLK